MGLQKCFKCHHRFSWGKIFKSNIFMYKPIQCSQCGTEHRITFLSRIVAAVVLVLPMYFFGFYLGWQWHLPYGYAFLLVVSLGIISLLLLPFVQKYRRS